MTPINFDGYIPYDWPQFQDLVRDLKIATDAADAAWKAFADDLNTYLAFLKLNDRYVIVRDKAHLRAFVANDLGGTVTDDGLLPGDEIELAIDAVFRAMAARINYAASQVEGQKPKVEFVYGVAFDQGIGSYLGSDLDIVMRQAKAAGDALRNFRNDALRPAIVRENLRIGAILSTAQPLEGVLGQTLPADPLASPAATTAAIAPLARTADTKHAGLIAFRRFAGAALARTPDIDPGSVISAFVTGQSISGQSKLPAWWAAMIGLSSWPRTANAVVIANKAWFIMRARAIYLKPGGEEADGWTDHYASGQSRTIDIKPPGQGVRVQIEIDATAGLTRRSPQIDYSLLPVAEVTQLEVGGTTLDYSATLS